jgi:plasmid stabilization system protein ParE
MGKKETTTKRPYEVRVTENALRNIDEITGYIAFIKSEPLNAIKVGDRIAETIHRIEQYPFSFKECEELATKTKVYRRAICLSWLIVYKIYQHQIVVLGIVHKSNKSSAIKKLRNVK